MIKYSTKEALEALNRIAASDDGRIVLAEIMRECRWNDTFVSFDSADNTMYHAARRGVWGGIRKAIKADHLKHIEFDYKLKAETTNDGRNDITNTRIKRPSDKPTKP